MNILSVNSIRVVGFLFFLGIVFTSNAQKNKKNADSDSTKFLQIKVKVTEGELSLKGASLNIYLGDKLIEKVDNDLGGTSKFWLAKNGYYTIEVKKRGYLKRLIVIETKYDDPKKRKKESLYQHDIEVAMEKDKGQANFYHDFPIGIVKYDPKKDEFVSNFKYNQNVNKEIRQEKMKKSQGKKG